MYYLQSNYVFIMLICCIFIILDMNMSNMESRNDLQSQSKLDYIDREREKGWVDVGFLPMDGTAVEEGGRTSPPGADKPPLTPYLLPLPGFDASLMPMKLPESSLTSSLSNSRPGSLPVSSRGGRPDSRGMTTGTERNGNSGSNNKLKNNNKNSSTSRGASVSQSLDAGLRSRLLPPVGDKNALTRASLQASGLFSPVDDQMIPADRPYTEEGMCSNRPISRSVLLKSGMEITPYYTEVVTGIYKYPLLIALLASADQRSKMKKDKHMDALTKPTLATASKSRDEYDHSPSGGGSSSKHQLQSSIYTNTEEEDESFDRLVIKVFDVIGHSECVIYAPIHEYMLFRDELQSKYEGNISQFYQPNTKQWWSNNIRYLIRVQLKRNGLLHMTISKKLIEEVVISAMKKSEDMKNNKNYGKRVTKIIKRTTINKHHSAPHSPNSIHSNNSDKYSEKMSLNSNSPISRNKAISRTDSECAVVVASSLEDDYDFDFDN